MFFQIFLSISVYPGLGTEHLEETPQFLSRHQNFLLFPIDFPLMQPFLFCWIAFDISDMTDSTAGFHDVLLLLRHPPEFSHDLSGRGQFRDFPNLTMSGLIYLIMW